VIACRSRDRERRWILCEVAAGHPHASRAVGCELCQRSKQPRLRSVLMVALCRTSGHEESPATLDRARQEQLGEEDSNPRLLIQSQLSYH
jgi:hypothetical protein